ncbi:BrxE family protein [Bradyrhizobium sp. F1.13.3]|uniref:BrxE family protein n=1 Tax=Bradyrhizobium sp. F1.13.3 TaxID=3156351 RepID=UPI003397F44D
MSKSGTFEQELDLAWLLKVRTVVARIGEMDLARWWNSTGQLGPQGASVVRRGLPRTHHFAQARSVFAVAAARCAQIFDPPDSVTLWRLTDPIEERLETVWEGWLDDAKSWRPFFEKIAAIKAADLSACLIDLNLVTAEEVAATSSLKKSSDGRSMQMPGLFDGSRKSVVMLALSFGNGSPGNLVVPYARRGDA